jgi:hypothetical protein
MKLIEVTRQFNTDDRNPKSKARTHPSQTPRRVGHPQNRLLASKAGAPGRQYAHNPQAKESGRPSRLNIPDVMYHGPLRLIEQTTKSKAGLFSKLERCSVRWRDSEDNLAGFCCRSQIFIHEVYGP